jgi:hypothetical protein
MSKPAEQHDTYILPPNFIESGTIFGGASKIRNVIEAGALVLLVGLPILGTPLRATAKIIALCFTALPLGIFGLMGVGGVSLSRFVYGFLKFLKNRRVLRGAEIRAQLENALDDAPKTEKRVGFLQYAAGYFRKSGKKQVAPEKRRAEGSVEDYLPIAKIENGVVYATDGRYLKLLELEPINFLLRSAREQRGIVYSLVSFLKISPVKLQFKALTRRADINKHLDGIRREIATEPDEHCRRLQEDYLRLIYKLGSREAVTRRFFLVFEYEGTSARKPDAREIAAALQTAVQTAKQYFLQCGNEVITHENEDEFLADVFYNVLNRAACSDVPLGKRVEQVAARYLGKLNDLPIAELLAPRSLDFTHGRYVLIDGVYSAYLLIPSGGSRCRCDQATPQYILSTTAMTMTAGRSFLFAFTASKHFAGKLFNMLKCNPRDTCAFLEYILANYLMSEICSFTLPLIYFAYSPPLLPPFFEKTPARFRRASAASAARAPTETNC